MSFSIHCVSTDAQCAKTKTTSYDIILKTLVLSFFQFGKKLVIEAGRSACIRAEVTISPSAVSTSCKLIVVFDCCNKVQQALALHRKHVNDILSSLICLLPLAHMQLVCLHVELFGGEIGAYHQNK